MTAAAKTLAVVGAGPGLGLSIAKRFGAAGFQVALLARNADKLDRLVAELDGLGVTARSYVADLTDRPGLTAALARVEADFGAIDVLEFSAVPGGAPVPATDITAETVLDVFEPQVLGAVSAVNAVLPGMRARKDGALLFTTGASSVHPLAMMGNVGIAGSGLRNYALALHQALAADGIFAAHVALDLFIEPGGGEADPDTLAERYFELYEHRAHPELKVGNYIEQALANASA
jgi:NAD(P)-dependent dehydrogenase (short-subunit alcohol dehydrogenase family)